MIDAVIVRVKELRNADETRPIPVDLVTSSGSGLDPDISVASAHFQAVRIAKARGLPLQQVEKMVLLKTTHRTFGFLGEKRINVLAINRALDLLSSPPITPLTIP
jgi:K+-transporting ATPase ATPase C chain